MVAALYVHLHLTQDKHTHEEPSLFYSNQWSFSIASYSQLRSMCPQRQVYIGWTIKG